MGINFGRFLRNKTNTFLIFGFLLIVLLISVLKIGNIIIINYKLKTTEERLKKILLATRCYGSDYCGMYYPFDTSYRREENPEFPLTFETDTNYINKKFKEKNPNSMSYFNSFTTPIGYIQREPMFDPFSKNKFFGYASWNMHDDLPMLAIVHSPGPDGIDDINFPELRDKIDLYLYENFHGRRHGFSSHEKNIIRTYVEDYLYDPSNGLVSRGDIFWLMDSGYNEYGWRRTESQIWNFSTINKDEAAAKIEDAGKIENTPDEKTEIPAENSRDNIIKSEKKVYIPFVFHTYINDTAQQNSSDGNQVNPGNIENQKNMIGKDFIDLIEHPRTLNKIEAKLLSQWKSNEPAWWSFIENLQIYDKTEEQFSVEPGILYSCMPVIGKSIILQSIEEISLNKNEQAIMRIIYLEKFLNSLESQSDKMDNPYQIRVHEELTRLCNETKALAEKK